MDDLSGLIPPTNAPIAERRRRIRERLRRFGPGPVGWFSDMCTMLDSDLDLQSDGMLVSHLARELECAVRKVLVPDHARRGAPGRPEEGGHKFEIEELLKSLGIADDDPARATWLVEAGQQQKFAHREHLRLRSLDEAMRERMGRLEAMYDTVLEAAEGRYLNFVDRLQALAAKPNPTDDDANRLLNEYPQDLLTLEAFFSFLESPAWLEPLHHTGFFGQPPAPDRYEDGVSYAWWPASSYLARIAATDPEGVVEIAVSIPETDNPRVNLDLVEVASRVPPQTALPLVKVLVAAVRRHSIILPERYADLAARFAVHSLPATALELMGALLHVDERGALIDDWHFEHILQRCGSNLTEHLGLSWLTLLADSLDQAVGALRKGQNGHGVDVSEVWYPALEADRPMAYLGPEIRLIAAIRDTAGQLLSDGHAGLAAILAVLDAHSWTIFRRLRLHLLEHWGAGTSFVTQALVDSGLISDASLTREWLRLARAHCETLGEEARAALLAAVDAGPDTKQWSDNYQRTYREEITPERLQAWVDLWRRDRRSAVRRILNPEQMESLQHLESLYGPAPSLDRQHQDAAFTAVPPASGLGELASLSTVDLVARVQSWIPEHGAFGLSNLPTYRSALRKVVADQALGHSTHAGLLAALDDHFLTEALRGFQDAAKNSILVDWDALVELTAKVGERTGTSGAHELHLEAVTLLAYAVTREANPAPPKLAEPIWQVIKTVLRSPDTLAPPSEPGTYRSDARAQSLRTAVEWSSWRRSHEASTDELTTLLDELLGGGAPLPGPSGPEVLATVFGEVFPILTELDPTWATDHAALLDTETAFGKTAWRAYLAAPSFTVTSAELLRSTYHAEAGRGTDQSNDEAARPRLALGKRLLFLFWQGGIELEEDESDLALYYAHTSAAIRRQLAAISVTYAFEQFPDGTAERVKRWWSWRLAAATIAGPQDGEARKELLDAVSRIATSGYFADDWSITQLRAVLRTSGELHYDNTTFDYLVRVAPAHTGAVLELLKELISSADERSGFPSFREDHIRSLLLVGLQDPEYEDTANRIINIAAVRGHRQFAVLLHSSPPEPGG